MGKGQKVGHKVGMIGRQWSVSRSDLENEGQTYHHECLLGKLPFVAYGS